MLTADKIAVIAAAIALVSAAVSVFAIYLPWKNNHDAEVYREALLALERSYGALVLGAEPGQPPKSDRINWLTSARHLESYKELRDSLKTKLYSRLCREHEEHWRHEFYLRLLKDRIHQRAYFEAGPIEPRSALVLFGFSAWPHDKTDRIEVLDVEKLFKESPLLQGNYGLQNYLEKFPQYGGASGA